MDLKKENYLSDLQLDVIKEEIIQFAVASGEIFFKTQKQIWTYELETGHFSQINTDDEILTAADGKLFTGCFETTSIWDIKTKSCLKTFPNPDMFDVRWYAWADSGQLICVAEGVEIYDLEKGVYSTAMSDDINFPFVIADGKIFFPDCSPFPSCSPPCLPDNLVIRSLDFKAKDDDIFKEIASMFKDTAYNFRDTMMRFLRMPKAARDKIYEELCLVNNKYGLPSTPQEISRKIKTYMKDYREPAEEIFSPEEYGRRSGEAIENYLNKKSIS